jgi:DNA modification methylase
MTRYQQLSFLAEKPAKSGKRRRSGTFVDNMRLPVHRWFRYSAGFSAEWVERLLMERVGRRPTLQVLDPFVGSGTTLLAADRASVTSFGIEAHPFVTRIARAKLAWGDPIDRFWSKAEEVLETAQSISPNGFEYPKLIQRCFTDSNLEKLDRLRRAWISQNRDDPASELVWLAITAILRPTSPAGTAQWQYILPNKTKKVVAEPFEAFREQVALIRRDMELFQSEVGQSRANLNLGDARHAPAISTNSIDLVITSPPYANNYDYADATRFEMSFWGEVESWADLHEAVRKRLIVSCSHHAAKKKLELETLLNQEELRPIKQAISQVCHTLAEERLQHGGKKHYHTMIAAYFYDLAQVWQELRRVCKPGAEVCFVIGDSAPYGIHVPVERWLGELALASEFKSFEFEKIRERNVKWKNRKHNVLLHEGHLWVRG